MIKKLIQYGDSSALIIDKPILELLNIEADASVEISTDGSNIIISPVYDVDRLKKLNKAMEKINRNHGETLKKLAQ
jgi:antitoxin component of MazEF toxin-antitoxin module